jgi:CRP-like cAMP-binding protein
MQPYLSPKTDNQDASAAETEGGLARLDYMVEGSFGLIQTLPLFQDLPPYVLLDVLRTAHITTLPKGVFLHGYGEPLSLFYIVLDGWVRLFKNSQDGKESTLQIIGAKQFLFNSGFTPNKAYAPMNAQTVERTRLLTMPLSGLRDALTRSSRLAENLLNLTAQRNQDILIHLENLTLRDAKERVGFFFLKIWMETNPNGLEFEIPFDKSLIASYLDLRAETFSRILKDFHKDGFAIEGRHVRLPDEKSLCRYCDPAAAAFCIHAEEQCLEIAPPRKR